MYSYQLFCVWYYCTILVYVLVFEKLIQLLCHTTKAWDRMYKFINSNRRANMFWARWQYRVCRPWKNETNVAFKSCTKSAIIIFYSSLRPRQWTDLLYLHTLACVGCWSRSSAISCNCMERGQCLGQLGPASRSCKPLTKIRYHSRKTQWQQDISGGCHLIS